MTMKTQDQIQADYLKFRGKCREYCEAAIAVDPTLTLVRGHYYCPQFGEQPHWWTVRKDGSVFDPTAAQFPSNGAGLYVPFNGLVECAQCGKEMKEAEASFESNYAFCSGQCHARFVGVW
jgi:hypothetical protein